MADYFLLKHVPGPDWDHSRLRREQDGWDEHAAFIDGLAAESVVVLGGPVGAGDGDYTLLVVDLESEAAVRATFEADPWEHTILEIESIEPWSVWVRGGRG
jgi:uncharacterized protein YciI